MRNFKFVGRWDEEGDSFFTGHVYLNEELYPGHFDGWSFGIPIEEMGIFPFDSLTFVKDDVVATQAEEYYND